MPKPNDIYLGAAGSEILLSDFGRTFSEGFIEFAREDRTASARLVKDIIARKRRFTITYSLVDGSDLEDLEDLYEIDSVLNLIVTYKTGTSVTYSVLLKPFERSRVLAVGDTLWAGVTLEMEQV